MTTCRSDVCSCSSELRPPHCPPLHGHQHPTFPGLLVRTHSPSFQRSQVGQNGTESQNATMSSQQELPSERGHLAKVFPFRCTGSSLHCVRTPLGASSTAGATSAPLDRQKGKREMPRPLPHPEGGTEAPAQAEYHVCPATFSEQRGARDQMTPSSEAGQTQFHHW